jgi:[ribosomal protein S5]-alanine N-acetyltransferase
MRLFGPINTARLTGSPLCAEDVAELRAMHDDPQAMKFVGGLRNEEETKRWLHRNLEHWSLHGFGIWMFRNSANGELVGRCGIRRAEVDGCAEVELGYSLVQQYWGKGFATEMVKPILGIGFEGIGQQSVVALIDAANTKSRNVAERAGFYFQKETLWQDSPVMLYRLERERWLKHDN